MEPPTCFFCSNVEYTPTSHCLASVCPWRYHFLGMHHCWNTSTSTHFAMQHWRPCIGRATEQGSESSPLHCRSGTEWQPTDFTFAHLRSSFLGWTPFANRRLIDVQKYEHHEHRSMKTLTFKLIHNYSATFFRFPTGSFDGVSEIPLPGLPRSMYAWAMTLNIANSWNIYIYISIHIYTYTHNQG